jgi:hypothetical protein
LTFSFFARHSLPRIIHPRDSSDYAKFPFRIEGQSAAIRAFCATRFDRREHETVVELPGEVWPASTLPVRGHFYFALSLNQA